jgi:hypothetical protein
MRFQLHNKEYLMLPHDPSSSISPTARTAIEKRNAAVSSTRADLERCDAKYKRLVEGLCDTEFYALMGIVVREGVVRNCVGEEQNKRFIEQLVDLHAQGQR